jgi:hypothetical protein
MSMKLNGASRCVSVLAVSLSALSHLSLSEIVPLGRMLLIEL